MDAPKPAAKEPNVVLWLVGAIFLGIFAWAASMYAVKVALFRPVDLMMRERAREKALEAWVLMANRLHISYADAMANPKKYLGKPVVWNTTGLKIAWKNPDKVNAGHPVAVAVIRGVDGTGVTLEYVGYLEKPVKN